MNRFLLFGGASLYPSGGWDDFKGDFETIDQAMASGAQIHRDGEIDWWHVVDITKMEIIKINK